MEYKLFLIETVTDLHVGTGKSDFGAIDHKVQRDHRGFPVVFDSALKGALKEHCKKQPDSSDLCNKVFGGNYTEENNLSNLIEEFKTNSKKSENAERNEEFKILDEFKKFLDDQVVDKTSDGKFEFNSAWLLSLTVRSHPGPNIQVTCPVILKDLTKKIKFFNLPFAEAFESEVNSILNCNNSPGIFLFASAPCQNCVIEHFEDQKINLNYLKDNLFPILFMLLPEGFCLVPNADFGNDQKDGFNFETVVDDFHLPARTRIKVGDENNNNLWFEQMVPAESRFFTVVGHPTTLSDDFSSFLNKIKNKPVNIGANASIGQGNTAFHLISSPKNDSHAATT